jgi:hypothetical protein
MTGREATELPSWPAWHLFARLRSQSGPFGRQNGVSPFFVLRADRQATGSYNLGSFAARQVVRER